MNEIEQRHGDMVIKLAKPGDQIKKSMTPEKWALLINACRQFLEAAQYLDQVKKIVIYEKGEEIIPRPGQQVPNMSPEMYDMLHMIIGISGEAGEIMEAWFTALRKGHFDWENVNEELGDLEFYLRGFYITAQMDRNVALQHNCEKLAIRYPNYNYSNEAAQKRADKEG